MAELDEMEEMEKALKTSTMTDKSIFTGSMVSIKRSSEGPPTGERHVQKRVVKFTHKQGSTAHAGAYTVTELNKSIESLIRALQELQTKIADVSDQSTTTLASYTESFDSILLSFVHGDIKTEITKTIFIKKLQYVLSVGLSDKILVDILPQDQLSNDDGILTVVGRPAVSGSNTKQMRHTTPFHFVKLLISKYLDKKYLSDDAKTSIEFVFNSLLEDANDFIKQEKGFVLSEEQWMNFKSHHCGQHKTKKQSSKCPKVEVIKLTTHAADTEGDYTAALEFGQAERVYYLVNPETISPKDFQMISTGLKDVMQVEELTFSENYTEKKQKLAKKVFEDIKLQVFTPSHIDNCVEVLSRFIFTLFNQRKNAAFPDEGNSFNREIKYFYDDNTDKNCTGKDYVCISANDIAEGNVDRYSSRIRLVNNEGAIVKQVAEFLESMNLLLAQKELQHSMLEMYYDSILDFLARYTELHKSQTFAGIYQIQEEEAHEYNEYVAVRKCIKRVHTEVLEGLESLEKEGISFDERDAGQAKLMYQLRQQIVQVHAPWCLYQVFDLKKLDEFVLVPSYDESSDKGVLNLEIYDRAYIPGQTNTTQLKSYTVVTGTDYRNGQIDKVMQGRKSSPYKVQFIHEMDGVVLDDVLNESIKFHLDFIINRIFTNFSSSFETLAENFCRFLGKNEDYSSRIVAELGSFEEETLSQGSAPVEIEVVGYTTDSFSLLSE